MAQQQQPQHPTYHYYPPPPTAAAPPPPQNYYSAQPPPSRAPDPRQALDRSTDTCARVGGLFLVGVSVAAITFSFMAAMSCNFVTLTVLKDRIREGITNNETLPPLIEQPDEGAVQAIVNGTRQLQFNFTTEAPAPTIPPFVSPVLPTEAPVAAPVIEPPTADETTAAPIDALPANNSTTAMPTDFLDTFPPSASPSSSPTAEEDKWATFSFGLFLYQDPLTALLPNGDELEVCYHYTYENNDSNVDQLPTKFRLARLGISIAIVAGGIAALVIVIEFFLSRVFCSRVFINLGCLTAMLSIPLTFVMFADSRCSPLAVITNDKGQQIGGCTLGDGAEEALIAGALWLVTFILACVLPKPLPLVRVIREMTNNDRFAFCCLCCGDLGCCPRLACCHRKPKQAQDYNDEDALGDMELMMPLPMNDQVADTQGHYYKQYHDETAGYTLQNQYTAAYKRWLDLEADYEVALVKFKDECKDAGVNWRKFLAKAKQRTKSENDEEANKKLLVDTSDTDIDDTDDVVEKVPQDEEMEDMLQDDELMRLVGVLLTIRGNSDFAKDVMTRIQNEIHEFTELEDERHIRAKASSDTSVISQTSSASASVHKAPVKTSANRIKAQSVYASAKTREDRSIPAGSVYVSTQSSNANEDAPAIQPFASGAANPTNSRIGSISQLGSLSRIQSSARPIGSTSEGAAGNKKHSGGCNQM